MSHRAVLVFTMAAFFAFWENAYFGHNTFPKSDAELISDGIVLLLMALGAVCCSIDATRGK